METREFLVAKIKTTGSCARAIKPERNATVNKMVFESLKEHTSAIWILDQRNTQRGAQQHDHEVC